MACQHSCAGAARHMKHHKPSRRRQTNHPHELEAEITWAPSAAYADDYELPDWLVGAD